MDNTFTKIQEQVPEFAREQFPRFVEFLEEYYKFLGTYNVSVEYCRDVETTSKDLYSFIRREIASKFPSALVNDKKLSGTIRNLFKTKGTINAVELLFRIFFNESVIIKQPGKNILRASDGRWKIERSILVESIFGELDFTRQIILTVDNDRGRFYIEVIRTVPVENGQYLFYFRPGNLLEIEENQRVDVYSNGKLIYQGVMKVSPSYLRVINPGKFWRIGQVFRITGTHKDTIARVSSLTPDGGVATTEIFEYGGIHDENQTAFISPFPQKPIEDDFNIDVEIVGYNVEEDRPIFHYTLTLNESTQMTTDSAVGLSDIQNEFSYFLGDYNEVSIEPRYNGNTAFTQSTTLIKSPDIFTETNVTQEEYAESIALFEYKFDYIINHRGEFVSDDGMLSNDNIRMQDNFFYQAFSYVIETQRNVHEYRNALSLIHPAGLKFFGELAKTTFIVFNQDVISYVSINIRYVNDDVTVEELFKWEMDKLEADNIVVEDRVKWEMMKPLTDIVTPQDSWYKDVTLNKYNSIDVEDFTSWSATKPIYSEVYTTDHAVYGWTKNLLDGGIIDDKLMWNATKLMSTNTEPVTDSIIKDLVIQKLDDISTIDSVEMIEVLKTVTHSVETSDEKILQCLKQITENVETNDVLYINNEKWLEHEVVVDDSIINDLSIYKFDTVSTMDSIDIMELFKSLSLSVETSDEKILQYTKQNADSIVTNDSFYINNEKMLGSSVITHDGTFQGVESFSYNDEGYFEGGYVITNNILTIS